MTLLDNALTRSVSTPVELAGQRAPSDGRSSQRASAARMSTSTDRPGSSALFGRSRNRPFRTPEEQERAQARAFCWAWLMFAMVASVGGNVLHAWMTAPPALRIGAAVAAIFPPSLLLGATHLVALLISTRRRRYRIVDLIVLVVVMLGAVGVAVFAFTISFYALRDLMILFGQGTNVAWRWPIAVDLSLIVSSLAMLSLTEARIAPTDYHGDESAPADADVDAPPAGPSQRRLWWESIAGDVRDELIDIRNVADLTPQRLGEILERIYDRNESDRGISGYTRLRVGEVKAIKASADGVLERTTAPAG